MSMRGFIFRLTFLGSFRFRWSRFFCRGGNHVAQTIKDGKWICAHCSTVIGG